MNWGDPVPLWIEALLQFAHMGDPCDRRKVCDVTMSWERFERLVEEIPPQLRFIKAERCAETHLFFSGIVFRPL